jgi:uncharacterized membrane protein
MIFRWTGGLAAVLILALAPPARADEVTVDDIPPYYCKVFSGSSSGNSCTAPYEAYGGNACGIYDAADDKNPQLEQWFGKAGGSCNADDVEEAKKMTFTARRRLRSLVSAGEDESVNDPMENPRFRPRNDAGNMYFAAECVVKKCGGGGSPSASPSREEEDDTPPPPPPRRPEPRYTPAPKPLVPPTFVFTACNDTNHFVLLATSERNSITLKFQTRGWWRINANTCLRLGPYTAGLFYFFASYPAGRPPIAYVNGGELLSLCVEREGYNFFRGSRDPCSSGVKKDFSHIITYEDYTWHIHD